MVWPAKALNLWTITHSSEGHGCANTNQGKREEGEARDVGGELHGRSRLEESGDVKKVREVECAVLGPKLSEEDSFIPSSMHTCVRPSYLRIAFSCTLVSVLVKTT